MRSPLGVDPTVLAAHDAAVGWYQSLEHDTSTAPCSFHQYCGSTVRSLRRRETLFVLTSAVACLTGVRLGASFVAVDRQHCVGPVVTAPAMRPPFLLTLMAWSYSSSLSTMAAVGVQYCCNCCFCPISKLLLWTAQLRNLRSPRRPSGDVDDD